MFKKIFLLIVVYTIFIFFFKGYYAFYPTIPVYPNNKDEVREVKQYIKSRTQRDIDFFKKTNKSVVYAFIPHVKESPEELNKIESSQNYIIFFFKYLINRARPEQVDPSIKPINTDTAQTPSYPAGHAYQAYLMAKVLSKKYPEKKQLFDKIAEECNLTRVKAGIHYPSDGEFSKKLVDIFNN
tara:strand:- start:39 stop:587 length:549 start_codon:yes stop_codon:yes gene_type:complete